MADAARPAERGVKLRRKAKSELTIEETVALLRSRAFEVPPDSDTSDAGRVIIHSRLGGIGADWDLDDAIALAERSTWRGWMDSLLGHNLGIEHYDGDRLRLYAFDVPRPEIVEPRTDGELADAILRKIAEYGDDWTIERAPNSVCIEATHMPVADDEAEYLQRLHANQ